MAPPGDTREYVRFEIVDMNGKALSKTVPKRHMQSAVYMYSGAAAMGANSEVLTFPDEVAAAGCPNLRLLPDMATLQRLPWADRPGAQVSRVYCEMAGFGGAAKNLALPRTVCLKALQELKEWRGEGLELLMGGELEFTVAQREGPAAPWRPLFDGVDIFATLQNTKFMDFCYEVERHMEPVGVDICTINAEYGAGQIELVFAPKFGIAAADMTATFRTGTKEIAQQYGHLASFMARPFGVKGVGNGGHFNFSLWKPGSGQAAGDDLISRIAQGKANVFHSADADGLSADARHFLAGILAHAPAMEAICSPTPACYTRHGNWAPVVGDWGRDDRTACVRVKADPKGSAGACYMELRMPSASANPYLVAAAVAAAGLDGLQRELELPGPKQTKEQGALELPKDLESALRALERDDYMVGKLGKDFVRWYTGVKRGELQAIEGRLSKGSGTDEELSAAWQHMYLEYV
uniref:Lengsin n=1 Tax=Zooxanthella nutricula TaxID=1333877 RepID=A0A7S2LQN7_9DINO|mmetsp:Transcript_64042/g.195846  ORF Transcript_64042/g.195846 Transcript_64042/m.195846 type:complete len:465 (+) Transcript_64042:373-1767(+)